VASILIISILEQTNLVPVFPDPLILGINGLITFIGAFFFQVFLSRFVLLPVLSAHSEGRDVLSLLLENSLVLGDQLLGGGAEDHFHLRADLLVLVFLGEEGEGLLFFFFLVIRCFGGCCSTLDYFLFHGGGFCHVLLLSAAISGLHVLNLF